MEKVIISCSLMVELDGSENILVLEKKAIDEIRRKGPELMMEMMAARERQGREKLGACSNCGQSKWKSRGRIARKIVTLAGAVTYWRQRVVCSVCGEERYPLDEELLLEPHKNVTLGVIEQSLWLAVEMPYDRASDGLRKVGMGTFVSGRQIQSWAKEEGKRLKERLEEERKRVFEQGVALPGPERKPPARVFVGVDGTFVNERGKPGEIEAKVGIIYSEKEKVAKNRWEILDKRTFACAGNIDRFREQFILECHRWGVWEAKEIVFVSDGAAWAKRMCKDYFPGAIYMLDYWHLMENTYKAFGKERQPIADSLLLIAKEGCGKEFYDSLDRLYRRSRDPTFREKLAELMEYVKSNVEGIENYRRIGMHASSGFIEKAVDVTICRRFKRRGMSWLYPGLSSLISLKLLKLNGEWEAYWRSRSLPC